MRKMLLMIGLFLTVLLTSLVQAQNFAASQIACAAPYAMPTAHKPPLSIAHLPQPVDERLVNAARVIGFTFADNTLALVATTALAECSATINGLEVRFAGVAWGFDAAQTPRAYVVAISPERGVALILNQALEVLDQVEVVGEVVQVPEGAQNALPLDVGIRADRVCYVLSDGQKHTRYCVGGVLSVRDHFPVRYDTQVASPVLTAAQRLGVDVALVDSDAAVSEIADGARVQACFVGAVGSACAADLIAAPFFEPILNGDYYDLALLVVVHPLEFEDYTVEAGSYRVQISGDFDFNETLEWTDEILLHLNGQLETGEAVELDIPATIAPFIGESDLQVAEILGLRLMIFCFFNECF